MHELAVSQQVLDVVLSHAGKAQATRVNRIELVVGEMTGFVNDAVQLCFASLSQGTIAEEAELVFERIPVRIRYRRCEAEFAPDDMDWTCPVCEAFAGDVIAGREFYVDNIEID